MASRLPALLALALAWPRSAAGGASAGGASAGGVGAAAAAGAPGGASAVPRGALLLRAAGWSPPGGRAAANASGVQARGKCPESGGGTYYTEFSASVQPQPFVTYRGLDFAQKSYRTYCDGGEDCGYPDPFPSHASREGAVWECAKFCNDDAKCRTYTVHTHRFLTGYRYECYLHEQWLCDTVTDSIGHDIFSAVCRAETDPC